MTAALFHLQVKDLMHKQVHYADASMNLVQLAAFLVEGGIHGAPVIGNNGTLVGVVSRTDLARAVTEGAQDEPHLSWFRMATDDGRTVESWTDLDPNDFPGGDRTVTDIMSHDVVTVDANLSVGRAAQVMIDNEVHRVLVTEGGEVVGILSATDLLRAVTHYEPMIDA